MMSSHQMTERQVLDAVLAEAIRNVFEEYVDRHGLSEVAEIFSRGVKIEVGDLLPSASYADRLKRVPPAWEKAFEVNASSDAAVRASCVEFVLAGLYATDRISRASNTGKSSTRSPEEQSMSRPIGGVIHTYQRYDPKTFPSPTQPAPDLVSGAMEHMLAHGSMRELSDEELARRSNWIPARSPVWGPAWRPSWNCSESASGRSLRRMRPAA